MLDIKRIRENTEEVRERLTARGADPTPPGGPCGPRRRPHVPGSRPGSLGVLVEPESRADPRPSGVAGGETQSTYAPRHSPLPG